MSIAFPPVEWKIWRRDPDNATAYQVDVSKRWSARSFQDERRMADLAAIRKDPRMNDTCEVIVGGVVFPLVGIELLLMLREMRRLVCITLVPIPEWSVRYTSPQFAWAPKAFDTVWRDYAGKNLDIVYEPMPYQLGTMLSILYNRPIYHSDEDKIAKLRQRRADRKQEQERRANPALSESLITDERKAFVFKSRTIDPSQIPLEDADTEEEDNIGADAAERKPISPSKVRRRRPGGKRGAAAKRREPYDTDKVDKMVTDMPVSITGIPPELSVVDLKGTQPATHHAWMRYHGPLIGPSEWELWNVYQHRALYLKFLAKLDVFDHYRGLPLQERDSKLWKTARRDGVTQLHLLQAGPRGQEMTDLTAYIASHKDTWRTDLDQRTGELPLDRSGQSPRREGSMDGFELEDGADITLEWMTAGSGAANRLRDVLTDSRLSDWDIEFRGEPVPLNRAVNVLRLNSAGKTPPFSTTQYSVVPDVRSRVPAGYGGFFATNTAKPISIYTEPFNRREYNERHDEFMIVQPSDTTPGLAIRVSKQPNVPVLRRVDYIARWLKPHAPADMKDPEIVRVYGVVEKWLNAVPGSALTCMRTIIRCQPRRIIPPGGGGSSASSASSYPSGLILAAVQVYLMRSGAVKEMVHQLALSTIKDSYAQSFEWVVYTEAMVRLIQSVPGWFPNADQIESWLYAGQNLLNSPNKFVYDAKYKVPDTEPATLSPSNRPVTNAAVLFALNATDESDVAIVHAVGNRTFAEQNQLNRDFELDNGESERPDSMSFAQAAINKTSAPAFLYYIPYASLNRFRSGDSKTPFENVNVADAFINPRRVRQLDALVPSSWQLTVRSAQDKYFAKVMNPDVPAVALTGAEEKNTTDFKYTLHRSWPAGLIGEIPVTLANKAKLVGTLNAMDLFDVRISRYHKIGSREDPLESVPLADATVAEATGLVKAALKAGVLLTGCPVPVPGWVWEAKVGAPMRLQVDVDAKTCTVVIPDTDAKEEPLTQPWDEFRELTDAIPQFTRVAGVIRTRGQAVGAWDWFTKRVLGESDVGTLLRLRSYIELRQFVFSVASNGRGGGPQSEALEDVAVFQLLGSICEYFPHALAFGKEPFEFNVRYAPILYAMSDRIRVHTVEKTRRRIVPIRQDEKGEWGALGDRRNRVLYPKQLAAVTALLERRVVGETVQMFMQKAGTGKTLVVGTTITNIIRTVTTGDFPRYVFVFTTPSAVQSVVNEFTALSFRTYKLFGSVVPVGEKSAYPAGKPLEPYAVYVISHDHMSESAVYGRLTPAVLFDAIGVMDEAHKLTNRGSDRSAWSDTYMDQLRETYLMTATEPGNAAKQRLLIPLLRRLCHYAVTDMNYKTVLNGILHYDYTNPARVEYPAVDPVQLSPSEQILFNQRVPVRFGGKNTNADIKTSEILPAALAWEHAYDRQVIALALAVLKRDKTQPGVMIVARSVKHRNDYFDALVRSGITDDGEIVLMGARTDKSTHVSRIDSDQKQNRDLATERRKRAIVTKNVDLSPTSGNYPKARVLIVPLSSNTGFNAHRFRHMIIRPFLTLGKDALAQIEQRINRFGQPSATVSIWRLNDGSGWYDELLKESGGPRHIRSMLATALSTDPYLIPAFGRTLSMELALRGSGVKSGADVPSSGSETESDTEARRARVPQSPRAMRPSMPLSDSPPSPASSSPVVSDADVDDDDDDDAAS